MLLGHLETPRLHTFSLAPAQLTGHYIHSTTPLDLALTYFPVRPVLWRASPLLEFHLVDIAELKQKSVAELHTLAEQLNITNYSGLRKQDLIFRIEQSLLDSDTVIRGEGVLEILPEGYGFLRSQDWNYLYGPDDIYVSPSQIKRFDLRTGDTVMGQVRPPKEGERYLALLKVEQVNFEEPEKTKHRIAFDNLRPAIPTRGSGWSGRTATCRMRVVDLLAPDRQGPARPDRRAAQGRQDDPAAEDRQRHQREPPGGRAHRAADRRAARGSHRHGGERQGARSSPPPSTSRPTATSRSPTW